MGRQIYFRRRTLISAVLAGVSSYVYATPIPVSFDLQLANPATAIFRLTNTSSTAQITGFSATIGDTDKNYDLVGSVAAATDTGTTLTWALNSPDTLQDNIRSDKVSWSFTGFDPGDRFDFNADIDDDVAGNTSESFNQVLFNNGAAPNSVITVLFADGMTTGSISMTLPDDTTANAVRYDYSAVGTIPEPATVFLIVTGMAATGAGLHSRRKG